MTPKSIAIFTHKVDLQDGQGRVNFELVRALLTQGHHVTVVAEFCSHEIAEHPNARFVQMRDHPLPTQFLRNLYYASKAGRWLRKHRQEFDLIQANGFVMWEPADVVAVHFVHGAWLRSPYFPFHWSTFSPYAWYQRVLTILNARFEKRCFEQASLLIAVSSHTRDEVASLGVPREKITVVYNGVDTEEFQPGPAERAHFGLPESVTMALFVGDLRTTRKNLDSVMKALVSVPELHIAVAGDATDSPFPALAADLGVSDRVHFIGKTREIDRLMRSTDFFVFPSRYEAHPLVLMEGLAAGLPLIVSSNFGAGDYVGGGGIVFGDSEDLSKLTAAMTMLATDSELRRSMSRSARQVALAFQWGRTVDGYVAVYFRFFDGTARSARSSRPNLNRQDKIL